ADGGRIGYAVDLPPLKHGAVEPYRVRAAEDSDLGFIAELAAAARGRSLVTCQRQAEHWQYELDGHGEWNMARRQLYLVETQSGERTGFLARIPFRPSRQTSRLIVTQFELKQGTPWRVATLSTLRSLIDANPEALEAGDSRPIETYSLGLGSDHPVYHAIPNHLARVVAARAWYVRVLDVRRFLLHIKTVLEDRLAASNEAGFSGELKLNFYRYGLQLSFGDGHLAIVEPWPDPDYRGADASLPDLTFLQLLFGHRSLADLEYAFADCQAFTEKGRVLLPILFPTRPSHIWQKS
ncbi:MAG: hypothetical protein ACR2PL_08075, partial [Dehalococcoidia bacterium]